MNYDSSYHGRCRMCGLDALLLPDGVCNGCHEEMEAEREKWENDEKIQDR